ncbi:MAG TPA: polysaccharide deacetylase family protein [Candidatus Binatia bacterium]|nr:polysaccharide deacetylase family protein [Candidatus Binatia bacterium]
MRALARKAVLGSGALRLAGRMRPASVAILMYHSVMDDPGARQDLLGGIVHSTQVFRQQMQLLTRQYHPVSLDEVMRFVRREAQLATRAVCVTFDDGYADNYEVAAPILEHAGVPSAIYVTADCVERRTLPWPSHLRYFFRTTQKACWMDGSGKTWPLGDADQRENAFLRACDEYCQMGEKRGHYIASAASALEVQMPADSGELMMTYDQMRSLAKRRHTIGSHTMTHPNMAYLDADEARRELTESKRILERELKSPVTHFSYPCPALSPHWSEQTLALTREIGYETAVTTDPGLALKGDDALRLKRVRPSKTVEGLQWNLECAFAGRPA